LSLLPFLSGYFTVPDYGLPEVRIAMLYQNQIRKAGQKPEQHFLFPIRVVGKEGFL
jgi:hypothetical protein